jgi:hypothetical protein
MTRWLLDMLLVGCCLTLGEAAPPPTSHLLGWEYAGTAPSFTLDQCENLHTGCAMGFRTTVDGTQRQVVVDQLKRNGSYCWQIQVTGTAIYSNSVCSP